MLVLVLVSACDRPVPRAWDMRGQANPVTAEAAMVVSAHPLASEVGRDVLLAGGNAVDAAVAVGFALAVVYPVAGNIGGGGFMVFRMADGTVSAIDYREMAPGGATHDMYLDSAGNVTDAGLTGHLAAGVPGAVAGMYAAHARYGRLSFADVVAPAIRLARDGFVLDEARSRSLQRSAERLGRFAASRRQFLVGDSAPAAGTQFRQPDLARTLEAIAEAGPGPFYRGWIADSIVAEMERGGGLISRTDLAAYQPEWREPITFTYRGYTIHSMAPASSGGITMALMLNMLEGWDTLPAFGTPEHVHLVAEVMSRAFADRNEYLGDPAFVDNRTAQLTAQAYADARRADIRPDRASPSTGIHPGLSESSETTHYSVIDADGNAVSVTTTINGGYGSAVTVSGAGFLLNNEMDDFTSAPGQPNVYGLVQGEANAIQPHKRMLSAMTPTIVVDPDGQLRLIVGTPGGPTIISTVSQVISNVIDHGMTLAEAIEAPRLHHQHLPDLVRFEHGGLAPWVVERLEAMGHAVEERTGHSGHVSAIEWTPAGWVGVDDPRGDGAAVGY